MPQYAYDAFAYEKRYRRVYEFGAEFWEEPIPTEALVKFLSKHESVKGLKAVEFGCGEGRDLVFLAKAGFNVIGVDTSRPALTRAKQRFKKENVDVDLLLADVINLALRDGTFDMAVNIGCLNMMIVQDVRDRHLHESHRVLKNGCKCFSCNLAADQPTSVEEFYRKLGKQPGTLTPRKVVVRGKEEEMVLPIIAAWPKSKEQYAAEFERAGFKIAQVEKEDTKPVGECWILIAQKT
jgi:ubiquinone/menaquinone biosynthesis C-methylase UbiE